jgi:Ca2+-transporting ATPase
MSIPATRMTSRPGDEMSSRAAPGLTTTEAEARLKRYGPNDLVPQEARHWWTPIIHALTDPMVLLLLAAGLVYVFLQEYRDGIVLLVALLPIVAMDLLLEVRAERTLDRLRSLAAPRALVLRDGREQAIPSRSLVPGDVLLLQEGDVLPADGWLVEAHGLQIDESSLTGESQPIQKSQASGQPGVLSPQSEDAHLAGFAGTTVLSGRGRLELAATGKNTQYGQIGALVAAAGSEATPLQRAITHLFRLLGAAALLFCVAVVGLEMLHGHGWATAILAGVSLGMAAIPEEFPIVFTLFLSLGVWRMARQQALVRRLAGVETLGSTTVICTDKTGTITQGKLALVRLWTPGEPASVGHDISSTEPTSAQRSLLQSALLTFVPTSRDALDRALAEAAGSLELVHPPDAALVHEYPFATSERLAAAIWREASGEQARLYAKGAWEGIRELLDPATPPEILAAFHLAHDVLTSQGLRVLAVAERALSQPSGHRSRDITGLQPLGLLGLMDPLRPGVRTALQECREAGVRVILLTGDNPQTAATIAHAAGLAGPGERLKAATGAHLEKASDAELKKLLETHHVFARVLPAQKYRIVRALKEGGAVVAMTGDGINDAPALKAADVGVAMGRRGTEVARAAATMVLLDDNFATIVAAVREGRRIFDNLRRAFGYLIAFHLPIVLSALLIPLTNAPLFLLPIHLVWLELIVHPTSALVFEGDAPDPRLMQRPPRRPDEPLLSRVAFLRMGLAGILATAAVVLAYLLAYFQGASAPQARALAFTLLIVSQVWLVLLERSPHLPIWRTFQRKNRWLPGILGVTLGSLALVLFVPAMRDLAQFDPLTLMDWSIVGLVALLLLACLEVVRFLTSRLQPKDTNSRA